MELGYRIGPAVDLRVRTDFREQNDNRIVLFLIIYLFYFPFKKLSLKKVAKKNSQNLFRSK